MTTLKENLQHLLRLQETDSRIDRLKAQMAALDSGATLADTFNKGKVVLEQQKANALKAGAAQKEAELALQSLDEKIKKVDKDLYGGKITASRELKNLQEELAMLQRQKDEAEGPLLERMETASVALTLAQATEAELRALADRYKQVRAVYKEQHAVLAAELAEQEKARLADVKPVPPALLSRYEAIRSKRKGIGAAPLLEDSCGACHTKLNTTLTDAVTAAQTVQTCEYCGRILVPQERG